MCTYSHHEHETITPAGSRTVRGVTCGGPQKPVSRLLCLGPAWKRRAFSPHSAWSRMSRGRAAG